MKTEVPEFTSDLESEIKLWIQKVVLDVVLTDGGGLWTVNFNEKPSKVKLSEPTFDAYLQRSLDLIKKYFTTTIFDGDSSDEDEEDYESYKLMNQLFPMLHSHKHDGGRVSDLYDDLRFIVFKKTPHQMRAEREIVEEMHESEDEFICEDCKNRIECSECCNECGKFIE